MAKNKQQLARLRIIDREFGRKSRVKTRYLVKLLKEFDLRVTQRTVQADIELLKSDKPIGYEAPIEYDNQNKAYYYSNPHYTIAAFGLREDEIKALSFYANILGVYRTSGILNHFTAAIDKVIAATQIQVTAKDGKLVDSMIFTDRQPPVIGGKFIPDIIMALEEQRIIQIEYCKDFDFDKSRKHEISPYFFRSYENRWYIVGKLKGKHSLTTFGLDRIKTLKVTEKKFAKDNVDAQEYYRHSYGITVPDEDPVKVILSFVPKQGNYIKSLPLHPTQQTLIDNMNELRISLHVKLTFELEAQLLGYGGSVSVIEPKNLAKNIKEAHLKAFKKYSL